ncbi:hypothetical protein [Nocardioides sp. ChNu-99]|uniref:hypothetical protein n=1 Tax=Nocardioides sp. ChNu-99 TaxID=2839897 RepID=UPI002404E2F5|nr:hypothetical protein [Nocardioides sp. ChNu-99]MDF9717205.1 hypothetical protein [Nocardioides sp. ChNu-99]
MDEIGWTARREGPVVWTQPQRLWRPDGQARKPPADRVPRSVAYGPAWRALGGGWFVPRSADPTVEQRILEVATVAGAVTTGSAALTGWAALRLHGALYFGDDPAPGRPVEVVDPTRQLRATSGRRPSRAALPAGDVAVVAGVRCTRPERALVDELRHLPDPVERVVAVDMAFAAHLTSVHRLRRWSRSALGVTAVRRLEELLDLCDERVLSPPESRLRSRWRAAGHPRPLCNARVHDDAGAFVGVPDLLDVEAGLAIEYDGAVHRSRARHRADTHRRERFEAAGLAVLVVVAGDLDDPGLDRRLTAARSRALASTAPRRWEADPPWGPARFTLDERIEHRESTTRPRRPPAECADSVPGGPDD